MPERYYTAAYTAKCLLLSSIGTAVSVAGAVSATVENKDVWAQLNETHMYLGLNVPLWWLYALIIILPFIGAFWSLTTDTLKGKGSVTGKLLTAATVGLVGAFIIVPAVTESPNIIVMMVVSLFGSYAGTVLLLLLGRLLNNQALQEDVVDSAAESIANAWRWVLSKLPGGDK